MWAVRGLEVPFHTTAARDVSALDRSLAPLLARPPERFGCATLYELRYRPDMAAAAGLPDQ